MSTTQQIDAVTETERDSLPHGEANNILRVALGFERFATAVIRDNIHARKNGLKVCDAYVNPNGREKGETVKTFPTDLIVPDVIGAVSHIRTLATLAARVNPEDVDIVVKAARVKLAALATLDAELFGAWVKSEKAHLSGPEAAALEIDGFAWSASRKGHSTVIRHAEAAEPGMRAYKATHAYVDAHAVSERDMAALASGERLY